MVENQEIIKDLANREGQQEIAKAIVNFGSLRNALRSEEAAIVSERMSNRSYYYACESEKFADAASSAAKSAVESVSSEISNVVTSSVTDIADYFGIARVESLNNYLPITGGTLTGSLFIAGANDRVVGFDVKNNGTNFDCGWNFENRDGAGFALRSVDFGSNNSTDRGAFHFWARNDTTSPELVGKPDGTLTWDGGNVITSKGGSMDSGLMFKPNTLEESDGTSVESVGGSKGTNPEEDTYYTMCIARDSNTSINSNSVSCRFGCLETKVKTDGYVSTGITAYKNETDSTVSATLSVNVDSSGNKSVKLDDNVIATFDSSGKLVFPNGTSMWVI